MNDNCEVAFGADELKKAISSGCRMLAIREHSEKQIRLKLLKKGFGLQAVNHCLDYLINENWLSETRFCNAFIRSKAAKGQGLIRIELELLQQNIKQSTIDQQLKLEDIDWQVICENTLLKKLGLSQEGLSDVASSTSSFDLSNGVANSTPTKSVQTMNKQRIKLENFLRYRGFSGEQIKIAMNKHLTIEYQELD